MFVNETAMSLYPQFFLDKCFGTKNMEDLNDSKTFNKQKSLQPKEKPTTLSKYIDFEDIFLYNTMGASCFLAIYFAESTTWTFRFGCQFKPKGW